MSRKKPDDSISFKNDAKIYLFLKDVPSYQNTRIYDRNLVQNSSKWHEIVVHHNGKHNRHDIIRALFNVVGDEEFYPVAYTRAFLSDRFLIRKCVPALHKIFEKNLNLKICRDNRPSEIVPLKVRFNVAEFEIGHVLPSTKLERLINYLYSRLETNGKIANILNLPVLYDLEEYYDVVFDFGNKPCFELLCKTIVQNNKFFKLNGIIFKNLEIKNLASITNFDKCTFQLFDFSCNKINSFENLKYLKNIKIEQLQLSGNPICNDPKYVFRVRELFPNLIILDGVVLSQIISGNVTSFREDVKIENEGILINEKPHDELNKYKFSKNWHQLIVKNKGSHTKEEILQGFFSAINPDLQSIYPCFYQVGNVDDSFLVRDCFEQLKDLVSKHLSIEIPGRKTTLKLELRINVSTLKDNHLNPYKIIMDTAAIRFNIMDKTLDLSAFCSSDEMKDIAITFAYGKFLYSILRQCSIKFTNNIVFLNLSNNNLKTTNCLKYLTKMNKLKIVDLSYNQIGNLNDLSDLGSETLQELIISHNPICETYLQSKKYVEDLKKMFPKLVKLDNVSIVNDSYMYKKNYICSIESYDFVEKFVKMFFTSYDSPYRSQLTEEMYHPKAMFTITSYFDSKRINSPDKSKLLHYVNLSRNLLLKEASNENLKNIYFGNKEIKHILDILPPTVHDFLSFNVDTLIFTSQMITITVTGVFKEPAVNFDEYDLLLFFSRTFVLIPVLSNLRCLEDGTEYQIINEQLNVTSVTSSRYKNSFKYTKEPENTSFVAVTPDEKEKFIVMLQEITRLKSVWCTRCLERGQWNFRRAVQAFLDMDESQLIPNNAFLSDVLTQ